MTTTDYLLLGYLLGMVAQILISVEDVRENKDNNPDVDLIHHHPAGPALMAFFIVLLSFVWPIYAFRAVARWLAGRCRAAAVRLREIAEED